MKLTCPHKEVVEAVVLGGITCYRHSDDAQFCTYMNDFKTRANDISAAYIGKLVYDHEVTPMMRVVLLSSEEARKNWYLQLSQASGDMLRSMLIGTSQIIFLIPAMKTVIIDELYHTFGQVVLTNMYEACKRQIMYPSKNADLKAKPVLPMASLVQSNVIETSIEIQSRLRSRQDRTRDSIASLYKK